LLRCGSEREKREEEVSIEGVAGHARG
jgi:hypothetical protein